MSPVCVPSRSAFLCGAGAVTVVAAGAGIAREWHPIVHAVAPVVVASLVTAFVFAAVALCRWLAACQRSAGVPGRAARSGPQERSQERGR